MGKLVTAKYIRLSLDEAKTGSLSIGNQRLLLDQHLMDSDMDGGEVLEFVDDGYSGLNFERPAVQELLELVREGKVNCILVKDFSRFGRDALETGYFIERVFPLFRVRFIAVSDGFDSFACEGGTGGMEVSFKFLINEYYSRDLSVKIRSAKREKALRGELVTKNCAFGYMLNEERNMVVDPPAADTVRLIFSMYAGEKSLAAITRRLYAEQRLTPSAYKKRRRGVTEEYEFQYVWQKPILLDILRDEQYLGVYLSGKTRTVEVGSRNRTKVAEEDWIRIPDHHEPVVSRELFDAAQEQLRVKGEPLRKRKLNTAKRYAAEMVSALGGKVVCGHCGHIMRISSTKNSAFHCRYTLSAADAACHKLRILKSELEAVVLESVKRQARIVVDAGLRSADVQAMYSPAAAEYMGKIEELRDEKQRIYEALVLGSIRPDEYKTQRTAIDAELARSFQVHEAILSESKKSLPDYDSIQAARKALRAKVLSQELVDLLIDRVLIFPDNRIEILWKLSGFMNCFAPEAGACVAI
ncbi:MAG: recombinase family protein [Oscillospiraceae bacterium]|nr:recombinase family protein [Oscillospiraceae bacterium]